MAERTMPMFIFINWEATWKRSAFSARRRASRSRLTSLPSFFTASPATAVAGLAVKNDGNDVSLDREARLLAENALRFQVASQLMKMNIGIVRSAIQGGTQ